MIRLADQINQINDALVRRLRSLPFGPPVTHIYNPLDYARAAHREYVRRFASSPVEVLFLGMNPGPWGMAQTGVPFGEVTIVRDWLRIEVEPDAPRKVHPHRPVEGLHCRRSEVSGARLWGWIRQTWRTPERFFRRFYVANYCPLLFLEAGGRNRTPDRLPKEERDPLLAVCDDAFRALVDVMRPRTVIGVGAFAARRARASLEGRDVLVGSMLHPSPASPAANRNWSAQAARTLEELAIRATTRPPGPLIRGSAE